MNPGSEQTYASHGPNAAAAEWTENHPKSALLLKGGHSLRTPGLDRLFVEGTATEMPASPELGPNTAPKHGSGCVLSSATAALLSKGLGLEHACRAAKHYTEGFLSSTPDLLGHHRASSWQWSSPSRQATSD
jgi:hydroxymethylpyrimidine/phosphomethylpyrimidine kinase